MNTIVYSGLRIITECSYYKFTVGDHASIVTKESDYSVEVTFPSGITSKELGNLLSIDVIDDMEVVPTKGDKFHKIPNTTVSLNGLEFYKLTAEPHVVRMLLVDDYPSRVCQNYSSTSIVINTKDKDDKDFKEYVFTNLKYLRLKSPRSFDFSKYEIHNFPKITIYNESLNLNSSNSYVHKLRYTHNRYLIKAVDYEHQFFHDISVILENFGVSLTRQNREETLENTSYVTYSINQTPTKYVHARYNDEQENILCHTLAVDFTLSTPDMILFFDFKNKYNNVHLLTNYSCFKTKDKYGEEWDAAIKWSQISEEFNHTYGQDNNSNFSNQCSFRAELFFYEVYDKNLDYIDEVIIDMKNLGMWESYD